MEGNKLQVMIEKDMDLNHRVMEESKKVIGSQSKRRRESQEISKKRVKIEDYRIPQLDGLDDSDSDMEVDNQERGRSAMKPRAFECNICSKNLYK